MDRLKQLLILLFLATGISSASAQSVAGETIFVHTNATLLLTGESLNCKLYCLNPADKKPSLISKIAYLELVGSDKKSVAKHKVYVENGMGEGYFFIPTTLKTGNYKLIAYTQWMLNSAATNFFQTDIAIVNPFQPLDKNNLSQDVVSKSQPSPASEWQLSTDKSSYGRREKVSLSVKNATDATGNYSVSVRKKDGLPAGPQPSAVGFSFSNLTPLSTLNVLPEMRGELIKGHLTSKTQSVANQPVALSIPGKSFGFKIVKTDQSGTFEFMLDKHPMAASAVVQVMGDKRNEYVVVLDEPTGADFSGLQFNLTMALSVANKQDIEARSVAIQIENAYFDIKKDSIEKAVASPSFFHSIEKRYVLDDYTRFPTLRETITEVVLELYTQRRSGKSTIHLRNEGINLEVYGSPLVLVDGLLIQDTNELYDYNPENIYAIDIINQPYVYGPKTFGGVANIITKNNDYEMRPSGDFLKKVEFQRPLPKKRNFSPDYNTGNSSRTPDYRYQLLWAPDWSLAKEKTLSFYTSDAAGIYEVVLQGFAANGTPVSVLSHFEVK